MSSTIPFTVRVEKELKDGLERLSTSLDRSRSWVVNQALERYVMNEQWNIAELQKRIKQADAGNFADPEEVDAFFSRWKDGN